MPGARAYCGFRLRCVAIMLLAVLATAGHVTIMAGGAGGMAMADAPEIAMACCDEGSGGAHATSACGAFFAPDIYHIPQPRTAPARRIAPCLAPARHGRTLAPPPTPPRSSRHA